MIPLTDAPFYAVGCKLSTDGAFGGVTVDENMQALRPDGSRVEGLMSPATSPTAAISSWTG